MSRPLIGKQINEVFTLNGTPVHSYVDPGRPLETMVRYLANKAMVLVVEGPSRSGKSTAVEYAIAARQRRDRVAATGGRAESSWIKVTDHRRSSDSLQLLQDRLAGGAFRGYVVLDDVHQLDRSHSAEAASLIRRFIDNHPAGKVIVVGINHTGRHLFGEATEFSRRLQRVVMDPDEQRIVRFVDLVEQLTNARLLQKQAFIKASRGSLHLAQMLCHAALAGERDVIGWVNRAIAVLPEQIHPEVRQSFSIFDVALRDLVRADRATATPGACLALLWLLATADSSKDEEGELEWKVELDLASAEYPHLSAAFRWMTGPAGLRGFIEQNPHVAELCALRNGAFSTRDPEFAYYLSTHPGPRWKELAREAEVDAELLIDGKVKLLIPLSRGGGAIAAAEPASFEGQSPFDELPLPWSHRLVIELREVLKLAYPTVTRAVDIVAAAGITHEHLSLPADMDASWKALMDAARAQDRFWNLISAVVHDERVSAYHERIRECVGSLLRRWENRNMDMDYKRGLDTLRGLVDEKPDAQEEFDTFEARLRQNMADERLHGRNPSTTAERNEIIRRLNEMSRRLSGNSFNDLCRGAPSAPRPAPTGSAPSTGSAGSAPSTTAEDAPPAIAVSMDMWTRILPTTYVRQLGAQDFPFVKVTVKNPGKADATVRVKAWIPEYSNEAVDMKTIAAGGESHIELLPGLKQDEIAKITEIRRTVLRVTVDRHSPGNEIIHDRTQDVWLLARDAALLAERMPDGSIRDLTKYLAAWVTPRAPGLDPALARARSRHPDRAISGYQPANAPPGDRRDIAARQVRAIFDTLKEDYGMGYVNSPLMIGAEPGYIAQRVRLPAAVLSDTSKGNANCIDGAVLFASLLELATLDPVLVLVPGHAFVGWKTWRGVDDYDFVETTMIGSSTFDEARRVGKLQYDDAVGGGFFKRPLFDPSGFACLIDVAACRQNGVIPLE